MIAPAEKLGLWTRMKSRLAGSSRQSLLAAADGSQPQGSGGYDAVASKGRRLPPRTDLRSEDHILPSTKRRKLVATGRDILRNFSIAGWMIRCHLDYVARFEFQPQTGDDNLNKLLAAFVKKASKKGAFESSGKFSRSQAMRMTEARKIIDGDVFWIKLAAGMVQILEGDRVQTPPGGVPAGVPYKPADFVHGIAVDSDTGRVKAVCVCRRQRDGVFAAEWGGGVGGYVFERVIDARNIWQHACWETTFRMDQVRGISPLASGMNTLQDIYEGIDLAMAKAKVAQMFGLAIYRQAVDEKEGWAVRNANSIVNEDEEPAGDEEAPAEDAAAEEDDERYDVDPGSGPFKLELKDKDRAEFLSTNTPEAELLNALAFCTDLSLKAIDIPYSFYDGSRINYYGKKVDVQQYENSAKSKREANQSLQDEWLQWRLTVAIASGEFVLPEGKTIEDCKGEWVPTAMPWIDKLRDIKADRLAIDGGQDSTVRAARRSGQDAYDLAREEMDYEQWLIAERAKRGLPPLAAKGDPSGKGEDDKADKADDNASANDAEIERLSHAR